MVYLITQLQNIFFKITELKWKKDISTTIVTSFLLLYYWQLKTTCIYYPTVSEGKKSGHDSIGSSAQVPQVEITTSTVAAISDYTSYDAWGSSSKFSGYCQNSFPCCCRTGALSSQKLPAIILYHLSLLTTCQLIQSQQKIPMLQITLPSGRAQFLRAHLIRSGLFRIISLLIND